jgi:predicted helicase
MTDSTSNAKRARIYYARVDEFARKEDKYRFLDEAGSVSGVEWQELVPDAKHTWLTEGMHDEFEGFLPMGTKEAKQKTGEGVEAIFKIYSLGLATNRDEWAYDFSSEVLDAKMSTFIRNYNSEVASYVAEYPVEDLDSFINNSANFLKWTDRLKESLEQRTFLRFDAQKVRPSLYRPFVSKFVYYDHLLNQRRYQQHLIFPPFNPYIDNLAICAGGYGRKPFSVLISRLIPDLNFYADPAQCFPFYIYNEDGTNRRENITDWALAEFRAQYKDKSITKLDIFHYVYALLHHPTYRTTYAANLKRELPRIPFVKTLADFRAFVIAGERLADLHVNYEAQPEYQLERIENEEAALDWRVERMRLSKDKGSIVYNDFLTLAGIPPAAFEYRLGNRSALEWIIDQYQVSTDKRSGITNDPNRADEPDYIVKLIGKVTTVSVETVQVVGALPLLQLS